MSFISKIDHNDFFDHFDSFTDITLLSGDKTTSLIFPKRHPIIRNLKNSLDEIAANMLEEEKKKEGGYYSGKVNFKFIEMMEATFSSEMPKSTRNRTPFADITDQELFKSNKPKLPKAPKNLKKDKGENQIKRKNYLRRKAAGVKRNKKSKSFSGHGCHLVGNRGGYLEGEGKAAKEIGRNLQRFLKKKKKFRKRGMRGCSLMSKKDLEESYDVDGGYTSCVYGYGDEGNSKFLKISNTGKLKNSLNISKERNMSNGSKLGLKLKKFLKRKLSKNKAHYSRKSQSRYNDDHMDDKKLNKLRKRVNRMKNGARREENPKKNPRRNKQKLDKGKHSFHQFMKNAKTNNSLIKSLRQRMGKERLISLKNKSKSREYNRSIVPPIPLGDVSKKYLREQITNGRIFNDSLSKMSTDELKTVKRKSRTRQDLASDLVHNRNSSSRLIKKIFGAGNLKTSDDRSGIQVSNRGYEVSSERNFKGLTNCLNSSEFLRSQMMRAKVYDTTDTTLPIGKSSPDGVRMKDKRKLNLNFKGMKMDIKAIYSQDKSDNGGRDIRNGQNGNPRISRNQESTAKRIEFPEIQMRKTRQKSREDKYYSNCRRIMAGSVAKKLNELGRGGMKHKKSSSLSRSFGIYSVLEDKRRSLDSTVYSKA